MNHQQKICELETDLRQGRIREVYSQLQTMNLPEVPHSLCRRYAAMARRCGDPFMGLRFLSKVKKEMSTNVHVGVERCMCLKETGAIYESGTLLNLFSGVMDPSVDVCKIHLAFNQSDFDGVINAANHYLQNFDEDCYESAVVQINKLAAKIAQQKVLPEIEDQLHQLLRHFRDEKWVRLTTNAHELYAQLLIQKREYKKAEEHLEQAYQSGLSDGLNEQIFIQRWQAVIEARKSESTQPLLDVKKKVRTHYETLRALDVEILKLRFDQDLFHHVYFGTPFPLYRSSLEDQFERAPEEYTLYPEAPISLSLSNGKLNGQHSLSPGGKTHLLLYALLSDFYRPIRLGTLFDGIFPDESFDIEHSKNRIHQIIFRARKWISENQVPIEIREENQQYRLHFATPVSIKIPKHPSFSANDFVLNSLRESFSVHEFTIAEAKKAVCKPTTTVHRALTAGVAQSRLSRRQTGRSTKYFFKR